MKYTRLAFLAAAFAAALGYLVLPVQSQTVTIPNLPAGSTPTGAEFIPAWQGRTVKLSIAQIWAAIPPASNSALGGVYSYTASSHQFLTKIGTDGSITAAQPAFSDISGTIAGGQVSGSYTGITGLGTVTVGTWNGTTIAVANGGTGTGTAGVGALNAITGQAYSGFSGTGNVLGSISPTVTGSFTATGLVTNADLVSSATTVNGVVCTLGATCTISTGTGNALFGTATGNTSGNIVTMSNTTVGVQDSGIPATSVPVLLSTQTASNSAYLSVALPSGYSTFEIRMINILPVSNAGVAAIIRLSENGGTSFISTSNYASAMQAGNITTGASGFSGSTTTTGFSLVSDNVGNATATPMTSTFTITGVTSTTSRKNAYWTSTWTDNAPDVATGTGGGYYYGDTNAINAIQLVMGSGNIASGTMELWGYK